MKSVKPLLKYYFNCHKYQSSMYSVYLGTYFDSLLHIDVTAHITCKINEQMIYHGKLYSRQLNNPENTTICFTTFVCNYL